MKVDIIGRGVIPGLGTIAPAYNRELNDQGVRRMLNFNAFRVYDSNTGILITRKNVNSVLEANATKPVVETPTPAPTTPVVETPVLKEPYVPPVVEYTEDPVDDVVTEIEDVVGDDVTVEDTETTDPVDDDQHYSKKNKKKNRH